MVILIVQRYESGCVRVWRDSSKMAVNSQKEGQVVKKEKSIAQDDVLM